MTSFGPLPSTGAASAVGTFASGAAERSAKVDVAGHALAAGRAELTSHPLSGDANASADRDADGWTGGAGGGDAGRRGEESSTGSEPETPTRPRLPDDPAGGRLDVTV